MPSLLDFQKRQLIISKGFDPERFDLDEDGGFIYPKEQKQPTLSPEVKPHTATEAFFRSAKSAIGPIAGGAAAIAASTPVNAPLAELGLAAAGPTAGLSLLPLGAALLIEGAAGAMAGGKAQQIIEPKVRGESPEQTQARLVEEEALRQEFPKASFLGENAPQLLLARPSPKMIGDAFKGGAKIITRQLAENPLVAKEVQALANVAGGAALGAGGEIANQVIGEQPFSIPRILGAGAVGGVISKPYNNPVNRFLRIADSPLPPEIGGEAMVEAARSGETLKSIPEKLTELQKKNLREEILRTPAHRQEYLGGDENFGRSFSPEATRIQADLEMPSAKAKKKDFTPYQRELFPEEPSVKDAGPKAPPITQKEYLGQKLQKTTQEIEKIRAKIEAEKYKQVIKAHEKELALQKQQLEEMKKTEAQKAAEAKKLKDAEEQAKIEAEAKNLTFKAYSEVRKKGGAAFQPDRAKYYEQQFPDFKAKYDAGDTTPFEPKRPSGPPEGTKFQRKADTGVKPAEQKSGGEELPLKAEKSILEKQLAEKGISGDPTIGLFRIMKALGEKRGIRLKFGRPNELVNKEGEPVRGVIDSVRQGVKNLVAKINPRTATLDTLGHELLHGFVADMESSPSKIERGIAERFNKLVETLPEYQSALAENPKLTPNEFVVENTGYDIVRRVFNADSEHGTWKSWKKDFMSALKVKWNRADASDFKRVLSNKFLNDPARLSPDDIKVTSKQTDTPEESNTQNENNTETIQSEVRSPEEGTTQSKGSGGEEQVGEESETGSQAEGRSREEGGTVKEQGEGQGLRVEDLTEAEKRYFDSWQKTEADRRETIGMSRDIPESSIRKFFYDIQSTRENKELYKKSIEEVNQKEQERIGKLSKEDLAREQEQKRLANESYLEAEKLQYKEDLADWKRRKKQAENKGLEFDENPPDNPELDAIQQKEENKKLEYQKEETGLNVDPLIEKYRNDLASRKDFREIEVQNEPTIGHGVKTPVEGYYSPDEDKAFAKPDSEGVALHETIHKLNNRYKKEIALRIKDYADKFNAEVEAGNAPERAMQDLAEALNEIHPLYNHHAANLGHLKKLNVTHAYEMWRAVDEGLASVANFQDPTRQKLRLRIQHNLSQILGKDFVDFIRNETSRPELFPRFKRLDSTTKEIDEIYKEHERLAEEFDNKYRLPASAVEPGSSTYKSATPEDLARFAASIEEGLARIQKLKEEDPGYYYQKVSQGLNPQDIKGNIEMIRRGKAFQKESPFSNALKDFVAGRLPLLGSDLDKLEIRTGKNGQILAPKIRESFEKERINLGKYWAPTQEEISKLSTKELDTLYSTMLAEKRSEKSFKDTLPPKLIPAYEIIRKTLKQKQLDQIAANQPVAQYNKDGKITYRLPKVNDFYVPEIVGRKQLETLLGDSESIGAKYLKADFIDLYKQKYGFTDEAAKALLEDVLGSYGGGLRGDTSHFNAVRKAEGIGLPDTWLEGDFDRSLERYWRRVAKDRAWFDTVESDPNAAYILGMKKDAWNQPIKPTRDDIYSISSNPLLQGVLNIIQQRNLKLNPKLDAYSRIASNLILGPATALNDMMSAPVLMSKFIPGVEHIPGFLGAFKNIKQGIENAKATGNIKTKLSDYQEIFSSSTEFVDRLNTISNMLTKYTGRDLGEKVSRGLTQALGEYLAPIHKRLAEAGNASSKRLLEKLANGPDWRSLSTEELGTRLSQLAQGTYDPRGLPSWVLDSPVAPIFKLSKWSIEQSNNFYKHVVIPAKNGNITPLIFSLFGATVGGEIIREIREKLQGKKLQIPSLQEISKSEEGFSGNVPAVTYNLMSAAAFTGATGFVGDIAKSVMDIANKNVPQGFNYPLAEIVGNTATKIGHAAQAIIDGEDPAAVSMKFMTDLAKSNTQVARMAINNFDRWNGEQKFKDAEMRRNLRVFRMLHDMPYSAQDFTGSNPYTNLKEKEFKQTSDIGEAVKLLPEIIQEKIKDAKGNPDVLKKSLTGLKINSLQTFPTPEKNPQEFLRYRRFLGATKGEEETNAVTADFFKRRNLNRIKSGMIP